MEYRRTDLNKKTNLGYGTEVPPLLDHVKIVFDQQELGEKEAVEFFDHFEESGWKTKTGVSIKNWKQVADQWIWNLKKTGFDKVALLKA
ncbi:hypothetical protein SAMN04489724_4326 [Algoriphagus locisalis]|uniref:Uncharacterized protein n=1 Tax=Algoriphagus locisalis TaxID=305507 RepID=A0A1I7DRA0_9BACT|nr:hypothetical protein [Algoriphagus locisalis]SFU14169.1 hypothetical protein SAMN04489724_4326 [Algoriphagus locisalis]